MRHCTDLNEAPEAMNQSQIHAITFQVCEYRRKLMPGEAAAFDKIEPWQQMCFAFGQPLNRKGRANAIRMSKFPQYAAPHNWEAIMHSEPMQRLSWVQRIIQALMTIIK